MLSYWIVRRPDNSPAGLVRAENGSVLLHLSAPVTGEFTLFSATEAVPILPDAEMRFPNAEALLGTENGKATCFAAAPNAAPLACYENRISRIYTKNAEPTPPAPELPTPAPDPPTADNISQNSTNVAEDLPQDADIQSQINTIDEKETDSIADTTRETEAFSALLRRADAFYEAYERIEPTEAEENMVQKEDNTGGIDLFPQAFPGARWRYVNGADVLPHYEGMWAQRNGETMRILAVPGRAAPRPPRALMGFTRFLRDPDGNGYWVKLILLSN